MIQIWNQDGRLGQVYRAENKGTEYPTAINRLNSAPATIDEPAGACTTWLLQDKRE